MSIALPTSPHKLHRKPNALPKANPAIQAIQDVVDDEIAHQTTPYADGLHLRENAESLFLPQTSGEAKGTVLLYHGYTAGPWQYKEMAQQFHDEGYHVYAPRMPGHGLANPDGTQSSRRMPGASFTTRWTDFSQKTYDAAAKLGAPVHAVGLSGGANVALDIGKNNPEVDSVTAFAPFLGNDGASGVLLPVLNLIDMVTFGLTGKLLDNIPRKATPSPKETPRTQGTWGQALAIYKVGANAKSIEVPLQVVTTAKDPLSGTRQAKSLLRKNPQQSKNGWHHFPESAGVPHPMVSPLENPNPESVAKVQQIVKDFVIHDKPTNQSS